MKKKLFVLLFLLMIISLCGCSKKEYSEKEIQNKLKKVYSDNFNELKCDELDEAIYFDGNLNYFATKDKVYQISVKKLFSNDKNCKEVEIEDLDSDIIGFSTAKAIQTKESVYYYNSQVKKFTHFLGVYNENMEPEASYYKKFFHELGENVFFDYYAIKGYSGIVSADNQLKMFKTKYSYTEDFREEENIYYADVETDFDSDEIVVRLLNRYVKTNKAFYEIKAYKTNKEECDKYEDVKCKYGFRLVKDKFLTENYSSVLYADRLNVIDTNHNYYQRLFVKK